MKILGIIPARYASTRFPAKALADIHGKSMVRRVYEQALKAHSLSKVVVATDHEEIFKHVKEFGEAVMTRSDHESGTDRCYEVLHKLSQSFDYVINIQGDEPFIMPEQIDLLATCLKSPDVQLATLIKRITDLETLFNPNTPKVIINKDFEAIYFSRQTIPYLRDIKQEDWLASHEFYKHIGIYAYRTDILKKITKLPVSALEKSEALEQLRWIENGYRIKLAITEYETIGIDTPEDLKKVAHLYDGKNIE
ncbi:MAG TPA: 3-deoxy-manno-octulosonate cytidylyltransferase [Cytophagaceae bacterium]|jgi:3-deoxy-manno-octulosonate cytidylyltransferase (CMP-KDO synthetase)|nr:3-deoxy-manno-octulosonate cytidylyltransferase [Cytophagaceae bacterium]